MSKAKISKKDISEYYRSNLFKLIKTSKGEKPMEYKEYIAAFSQYLCLKDEAYQYNLTYLVAQNKAFELFIRDAQRNYSRILHLIERINSTASVQYFLQQKPEEYKKLNVTLNNFLESDLDGNIRLAEEISILKVSCYPKDDIFTLRYLSQSRSGFVDMKLSKLENLVDMVLHTA